MRFEIITIFPQTFEPYLNVGILRRARGWKKAIDVRVHNLRDFTSDKHKTVDDRPYGGGAGMLLKAEPIIRAIARVKSRTGTGMRSRNSARPKRKTTRVILFSAKGKTYDQKKARELSTYDQLILICGRYEGVDERVLNYVDEEISVGEYILTGGEIPAMIVIDSVARLLPGVLGHEDSNKDESHSKKGVLEYPHFTRPESLELPKRLEKYLVRPKSKRIKNQVPSVLLSGDHEKVADWREKKKRKIRDRFA